MIKFTAKNIIFLKNKIPMGIFSRKPANCTICNKQITHKNKAKREWGVKSPLCSDCYLDKMKESYDASIICLLYTSPSPRDLSTSRMPSSA